MDITNYKYETDLHSQGYKYIVGVDEAGRGPLMGPVMAAAVCIPKGFDYSEINDSKKLSAKKRDRLYEKIVSECAVGIGSSSVEYIDLFNIRQATMMAMREAIYNVPEADYAIIDGDFIPPQLGIPATPIIGGDRLSISIAAASIIAKVTRDRLILDLHEKMPIYGWDRNKGYGTKEHRESIKLYGPSPYHRKSFGGVKEYATSRE